MSYLEKEQNIIKKLQETNYEMFDGDKDEALDFVGSHLEKFPNYVNIVIREQIMTPIWKQRFDGEILRNHIQDIDQQRKIAHDSAISSINILNRLSKNLGLEPFADIDTTDRHTVANFVGQYVNELYNNGIGNTMDDAVLNKTMEYNHKEPSKRLQELDQKFGHLTIPSNTEQEQMYE